MVGVLIADPWTSAMVGVLIVDPSWSNAKEASLLVSTNLILKSAVVAS